ncbi:endothelial cell-specific chemotaxis regulator isoform X4 [Calonectris borealis]|uniref:endothelial cell-specific chemotaxis regulator isoform X4 n=1 Tax=Calonectris borealis TaxID=1323832 RepID=UPI003F4C05CD
MLAPSVHPLLWLFGCVLFRGTTTSTDSSVHAVTGQPQSTPHSPEVKNHTSEPSVKSTSPTDLNLTSVGQTTTAKSPSVTTTLLALTVQDEKSSGSSSTAASPPQGQEPKRSESTTTSATQGASSFPSQRGTSQPVTPTPKSSGFLPVPTPTDDKSPLTVAAFDKQKPGTSMVSESCSAGTSQKDNSITLISMKNINMNNSMSYPPSEKVL